MLDDNCVWFSIKEYCSLTGKGKRTIYRYRKEGKIRTKIVKHTLYVAVDKGKVIINNDNLIIFGK